MNISEIKDLLAQFDASTLREFSYKNNGEELNLSKNQTSSVAATPVAPAVEVVAAPQTPVVAPVVEASATPAVAAEPVAAPAQEPKVMSLKVHWLGWLTCHQLRINRPLYL